MNSAEIEFEGAPTGPRRVYANELAPWKDTRQTPDRWFRDSWRQFVLSPDEILARAVAPADLGDDCDDGGLYFLIDPDGLIAYVGMSTGIGTRLSNHARRRMPMDRIATLTGIPEIFIKDMEAFYIHCLCPPINNDLPTPCRFMDDDIAAAKAGELWEGWQPVEWLVWRDPAARTAKLRTMDGRTYQHWTVPKW